MQREEDTQSTSQQGLAPGGCAGQKGKVFWKEHDVKWPGGCGALCSASRDHPGSAIRVALAAAVFSWGAWGMGQSSGEPPPRTCSHMWPGGVWLPQASPVPWEAGGAHQARSSTVKPPQTWLMPGIDRKVHRAEASLQQREDGTWEGQGLAPGWPAPPAHVQPPAVSDPHPPPPLGVICCCRQPGRHWPRRSRGWTGCRPS